MPDSSQINLDDSDFRGRFKGAISSPGSQSNVSSTQTPIDPTRPVPSSRSITDIDPRSLRSTYGLHRKVYMDSIRQDPQPTPLAQTSIGTNDGVEKSEHDQPPPQLTPTLPNNYLPDNNLEPTLAVPLTAEDIIRRAPRPSRSKKRFALRSLGITAMALIIAFGATSFINEKSLKTTLAKISSTAAMKIVQDVATPNSRATFTAAAGEPSAAAIANYSVAPSLPRYLSIPSLGVYSRVRDLGLAANGQLSSPSNNYDTGWYNASSLAGDQGAMLIDGHVGTSTNHGVFYGIRSLTAGDVIQVIRGDGQIFIYSVVSSQIVNGQNIDMQSAVSSFKSGTPGLNLITAAGDVIPGTNDSSQRIIVYATLE